MRFLVKAASNHEQSGLFQKVLILYIELLQGRNELGQELESQRLNISAMTSSLIHRSLKFPGNSQVLVISVHTILCRTKGRQLHDMLAHPFEN